MTKNSFSTLYYTTNYSIVYRDLFIGAPIELHFKNLEDEYSPVNKSLKFSVLLGRLIKDSLALDYHTASMRIYHFVGLIIHQLPETRMDLFDQTYYEFELAFLHNKSNRMEARSTSELESLVRAQQKFIAKGYHIQSLKYKIQDLISHKIYDEFECFGNNLL